MYRYSLVNIDYNGYIANIHLLNEYKIGIKYSVFS